MMILRIPNTGFVSVVVHNMYVGTLVLCCVVMYKIMYKDTCTIIVTAISSRNPNFLLENKKLYQPSTENEERKLAP